MIDVGGSGDGPFAIACFADAVVPDSAARTEFQDAIAVVTSVSAAVLSSAEALSARPLLSALSARARTFGVRDTSRSPAAVERVELTIAVSKPGKAPMTTTRAVASPVERCVVATRIATTAALTPVVVSAGLFAIVLPTLDIRSSLYSMMVRPRARA